MKIINAQASVLVENDPIKKIEKCGRVCYKSEDKITEDSAEKFVANIIKRGHEAVLEHASFIFQVSRSVYEDLRDIVMFVENRYPVKMYLRFTDSEGYIVSGNVRAWRDFFHFAGVPPYMDDFVESNPILFPEFKKVSSSSFREGPVRQISVNELVSTYQRLVHEDISVKFICDRGISHEIVRHRPASFCQESTRYCNYSKDGFGGEITVIKPMSFDCSDSPYRIWKRSCENAETAYFDLLDEGCTPQEARDVLPNSLKTELIMTAPLMEWCHFFKLRMSAAAHPQMREVASYAYDAMNSFLWDAHTINLDTCENTKNNMRRIR